MVVAQARNYETMHSRKLIGSATQIIQAGLVIARKRNRTGKAPDVVSHKPAEGDSAEMRGTAWKPLNRRIRTRMYGGVGGRVVN